MAMQYQVRWTTKKRIDELRKAGSLSDGMVVDSFSGFLMVEPVGSDLGDGEILTPEFADYELSPAWCLVPKTKLEQARHMLGLKPVNHKASYEEASLPGDIGA